MTPGNGGVPFFEPISLAFDSVPEDDVLLRLLVDVHCRGYDPDHDDSRELTDRECLPYSFLLQVMMRFSRTCRCIYKKQLDADDYQLSNRDVRDLGVGQ